MTIFLDAKSCIFEHLAKECVSKNFPFLLFSATAGGGHKVDVLTCNKEQKAQLLPADWCTPALHASPAPQPSIHYQQGVAQDRLAGVSPYALTNIFFAQRLVACLKKE